MAYPLISCVMPTCNRRPFIAAAVRAYELQSYPNKELVVVDNGEDRVEDLIPVGPWYSYHYVGAEKLSTGAMRNKACMFAEGEIIAHWDDDDYSHPLRLMEQYRHMQSMSVSMCGYNQMYFLAEDTEQAWLYSNPELYALGTSLMYKRDYWKGHRFPDLDVAEDKEFIEPAQWRRAMACKAAGDRLIARIHEGNTCNKRKYMSAPMWTAVPYDIVRKMVPCPTQ